MKGVLQMLGVQKKNTRKVVLVLLTILTSQTFLYANQVFAKEPVVLHFAHSASVDSPKGKIALRFQELVQNRLGSQFVKVEVYPKGMLFDDDQLAPAVLKNRVQMIAAPVSNLQLYSPRFKLFDLPFLFLTEKAASRFLQGVYGERLLSLVENIDAVGLAYLNNGMKQISSSKKVVVSEDAKNLNFLISNSDIADIQFRQIGAQPIVGNLNKVVTQLKNQVVDGQENTWSDIYNLQVYEHQPYVLESNHVYLADMIIASKEFWESLPDQIRIGLLHSSLYWKSNVSWIAKKR